MAKNFFRQLGTGVASLIFGVALSIFIYAAATGVVNSTPALLLYVTTFLMMLRFWWRYASLFLQHFPSHTFWQFLLDFAGSFFGILTILYVGNILTWSLLAAATMLVSAVRCGLSWKEAAKGQKKALKATLGGALGMLVVAGAIYGLAYATLADTLYLAPAAFVIVLVFVIVSSRK
jgi:hypothetical protein